MQVTETLSEGLKRGFKIVLPAQDIDRKVEDKLRAGRVSASAISETMGLLNRAANVLSGVAAAGKSVASDLVSGTQPRPSGSSGTTGASASPDAGKPGSGEGRR